MVRLSPKQEQFRDYLAEILETAAVDAADVVNCLEGSDHIELAMSDAYSAPETDTEQREKLGAAVAAEYLAAAEKAGVDVSGKAGVVSACVVEKFRFYRYTNSIGYSSAIPMLAHLNDETAKPRRDAAVAAETEKQTAAYAESIARQVCEDGAAILGGGPALFDSPALKKFVGNVLKEANASIEQHMRAKAESRMLDHRLKASSSIPSHAAAAMRTEAVPSAGVKRIGEWFEGQWKAWQQQYPVCLSEADIAGRDYRNEAEVFLSHYPADLRD